MTNTPLYDQLAAESEWTPDQLREPFDLRGTISHSYAVAQQRLATRARLRRLVKLRQRQQQRRQRRVTPLP